MTSADIARKLRLSKRTIDFHLDNARINLQAGTRTEAAIKGRSGRPDQTMIRPEG
jgi:DNA-binding NarL/FixJ family response regulator